MRSSRWLPWSLLLGACATAPIDRAALVATGDDALVTLDECAADLATADFVAFGEQHETPPVHATHLALLERLHAARGNVVIALEMFERDVQNPLLLYLRGVIDEATFLDQTRPWSSYARDYRPFVEFAKKHGLVVLAANAPAALVKKARAQGLASVAGDRHVAREVSAPEDDAWDEFRAAMRGHPVESEAALKGYYDAQCLRDDTMAETIADYLAARHAVQDRPVVVLVCGHLHSDYRRGAVGRVLARLPETDVRVLTTEEVDDVRGGVYRSPRRIADYVVVVPKGSSVPVPRTQPPVAAAEPMPPPAQTPPTLVDAAPTGNPEGLRPALGIQPDYAGGDGGVRVEAVRPDGPAEKAGIEPGDVLVALAGRPVADVQSYTEALDALTIGRSVTVRVRRGDAEVDLQVLVGSRSANR